jgi:hypothetical protein
MAEYQKIFNYVIAVEGQRLWIRGSKKMLIALMTGIVFASFGVGMARTMLTASSSDWAVMGSPTGRIYPLAQHPIGDRIATYAFAFLVGGIFFIAGVAAIVASLRTMAVDWLFDKDAGIATLGKRSWPLDQIRALRPRADTFLKAPLGISLMMELTGGEQVRLLGGMAPKNSTVAGPKAILEPIAVQMAHWLAVPLKPCAVTDRRLDEMPERAVSADSASSAQEDEKIEPQMGTPSWLQCPAPRRVRRRRLAMLPSVLGWGLIVMPLVAVMIWVGARFWNAWSIKQSMRSTSGRVIGLFRDDRQNHHGVCFQFAVDGHTYQNWDMNVPAALWATEKRGGTVQISYLPSAPQHSNLGSAPPVQLAQLLPEDWPVWIVVLIPYFLLALVGARRLRTDGQRLRGVVLLGQRGSMSQGMLSHSQQMAGRDRTPMRVSINGLPIYKLWQSVESDPNQIRYEFVVDSVKRFGYVPADLPGVIRPDGLLGVVYDPLDAEVHMPLPVIERYLAFE